MSNNFIESEDNEQDGYNAHAHDKYDEYEVIITRNNELMDIIK